MIVLIILLVYTWVGILINSAILGKEGDWVDGVDLFCAIALWMPIIILYILAKIGLTNPKKHIIIYLKMKERCKAWEQKNKE